MSKRFLDKAYALDTPEETRALYDRWAASYDDEIAANGYATPARVAHALAAQVGDRTAPVLDYGCGTGLSGEALHAAGFTVIDGMDPSPAMLDGAREKGVYRNLALLDLDDSAPLPQGAYPAITAAGVIGVGAAPADTLDMLLTALPPGGLLGFSFNDHALADPQYEGRLAPWLERGDARLLSREHGPHLPGAGIGAMVYVVART
ncbi:class I SAM-dependent DNA methyltransferase [Roseovarius ramblicola]|uniref:Class I SAM-dependent DNA methyltransferase n=1 Tax=Roseovarius ramblicola TaxID=2022336 RepID=A0ABV5I1G6_9RHOB